MYRDEDFKFAPEDVGFLEAVLDSRCGGALQQAPERIPCNAVGVSSAATAFLACSSSRQLPATWSALAPPTLAANVFQLTSVSNAMAGNAESSVPPAPFSDRESRATQSAPTTSHCLIDLPSFPPLSSSGFAIAARSSDGSPLVRHSLPQTQHSLASRRPTQQLRHAPDAQPSRVAKQAVSAPERALPWPWSQGPLGCIASLPPSSAAWNRQPQPLPSTSPGLPVRGTPNGCLDVFGPMGTDMILDENLFAEIEATPWPGFLTQLSGGVTDLLALPQRPKAPAVCAAVNAILGVASGAAATAVSAPLMPPEPDPQVPPLAGVPSVRSSAASSGFLQQAAPSPNEFAFGPVPMQAAGPSGAQRPWQDDGEPQSQLLHPQALCAPILWQPQYRSQPQMQLQPQPLPHCLPLGWPSPTAVVDFAALPIAPYPVFALGQGPACAAVCTTQAASCVGPASGLQPAGAYSGAVAVSLTRLKVGAPTDPGAQAAPHEDAPVRPAGAEAMDLGAVTQPKLGAAAASAVSGCSAAGVCSAAMVGLVRTEAESSQPGMVAEPGAAAGLTTTSDAAGGGGGAAGCGGGDGGSISGLGGSRSRSNITLEGLRAMFELPAQEVVRALGISATDLKRRCRHLGIRRWPQRKLISLKRLAEAVADDRDLTAEERQSVLDQVAQNRAKIFEEPDAELDTQLKSLRQVQYKRHFMERRGDR